MKKVLSFRFRDTLGKEINHILRLAAKSETESIVVDDENLGASGLFNIARHK